MWNTYGNYERTQIRGLSEKELAARIDEIPALGTTDDVVDFVRILTE